MRALRYAFDEAFASLWRGRQSGAAVDGDDRARAVRPRRLPDRDRNLRAARRRVERAAELSVYLKDEATAADRQRDRSRARAGRVDRRRASTSRRATRSPGSSRRSPTWRPRSTRSATNPLPASLRGAAASRRPRRRTRVDALGARLRPMAGVADVRYDRQWLDAAAVGGRRGSRRSGCCSASRPDDRRRADGGQRRAPGALRAARRAGNHGARRRAAGLHPRSVRDGRGAAGRASARLVALLVLAIAFFALRARYLAPLAAALESLVDPFSAARARALLLVVGGMVVGCVGGLVAASMAPAVVNGRYRILTLVLRRHYTGFSRRTIHSRGPACHAS